MPKRPASSPPSGPNISQRYVASAFPCCTISQEMYNGNTEKNKTFVLLFLTDGGSGPVYAMPLLVSASNCSFVYFSFHFLSSSPLVLPLSASPEFPGFRPPSPLCSGTASGVNQSSSSSTSSMLLFSSTNLTLSHACSSLEVTMATQYDQ